MNNRIFELAKEADLIEWDILPSGARTPDHESVVKARKFAELIVRECGIVADQWVNDEDNGQNLVSAKLKQHFGVEE